MHDQISTDKNHHAQNAADHVVNAGHGQLVEARWSNSTYSLDMSDTGIDGQIPSRFPVANRPSNFGQ